MAVTETIGATGRMFSTIQAWEDAIPATLTDDYIGECYNDAEFLTTGTTIIAGHTVGAFTITLTTAAGQSFRDHASVQANPLRYDQTKGVALRSTNAYTVTLDINNAGVRVSKLQVQNGATAGGASVALRAQSGSAAIVDGAICEGSRGGDVVADLGNSQFRNIIAINRANSGNGFSFSYTTQLQLNLTAVRPSDKTISGRAFSALGASTVKLRNCAGFGFTTFCNSIEGTSSHNASDVAISSGSNNQASKTYANQFEVTTDSGRDFRLKTGSDCIDTGVTEVNAATDIVGTSRPQGSAYDIGAWELVSAAPPSPGSVFASSRFSLHHSRRDVFRQRSV